MSCRTKSLCQLLAAILVTWNFGNLTRAETATPALNQLTETEKSEGWKLLFDGKSTKGWRNYQSESVNSGWKIVAGALTRSAKDAGDIVTADQFDAFELRIQFKISPKGNSGIMYHVTEQGNTPWQTGPEAQIIDNMDGHDGEKTGWLYQLYRTDVDATKPAGEWNEMRLLITPEKCTHAINGTEYFKYVKGSADWDARVVASKFSEFEHFGKATRGHICLQDHGDEVSFRDIKIRNLPSKP